MSIFVESALSEAQQPTKVPRIGYLTGATPDGQSHPIQAFPQGGARLATNPFPTGSLSWNMTMGIVTVASLARRVDIEPPVTITSTLRRTSSAASAGTRSSFPSAYRCSMTMFFPSTYPSSRRPCRNASMRAALAEGEAGVRNPIRGTFFDCCASAGWSKLRDRIASNTETIFRFIAFLRSLSFLAPLGERIEVRGPLAIVTTLTLPSPRGRGK